MAYHQDIPIQLFVSQEYHTPAVQVIVDTWRVEPQLVIERVIEHFREMGIYRIRPNHHRLIKKAMLNHLKTSPEIMRMVVKNRNDEMKRQRNRHAD